MGYQFAHVSTFSRKGNTVGRSVRAICDEAARADGAAPHVENPEPPTILHGRDPAEIPDAIEAEIKEAKAARRGQGRGNSIRKDTHVLEGMVLSYPKTTAEIEADPVELAKYQAWKRDAVDWIIADQNRRGVETGSVVEHRDEAHPHIHGLGWTKANTRMDVRDTHPGHRADREARDAGGDEKAARRAYRAAMRDWQDRHHQELAGKHGMTRLGPGRLRLTRDEWKAKQAEAVQLAERLAKLDRADELVEQKAAEIADSRKHTIIVAAMMQAGTHLREAKAEADAIRADAERAAAASMTGARQEAAAVVAAAHQEAVAAVEAAHQEAAAVVEAAHQKAMETRQGSAAIEHGIDLWGQGKIAASVTVEGRRTLALLMPDSEKPTTIARLKPAWDWLSEWCHRQAEQVKAAMAVVTDAKVLAAKAAKLRPHLEPAEQRLAAEIKAKAQAAVQAERERQEAARQAEESRQEAIKKAEEARMGAFAKARQEAMRRALEQQAAPPPPVPQAASVPVPVKPVVPIDLSRPLLVWPQPADQASYRVPGTRHAADVVAALALLSRDDLARLRQITEAEAERWKTADRDRAAVARWGLERVEAELGRRPAEAARPLVAPARPAAVPVPVPAARRSVHTSKPKSQNTR